MTLTLTLSGQRHYGLLLKYNIKEQVLSTIWGVTTIVLSDNQVTFKQDTIVNNTSLAPKLQVLTTMLMVIHIHLDLRKMFKFAVPCSHDNNYF